MNCGHSMLPCCAITAFAMVELCQRSKTNPGTTASTISSAVFFNSLLERLLQLGGQHGVVGEDLHQHLARTTVGGHLDEYSFGHGARQAARRKPPLVRFRADGIVHHHRSVHRPEDA